MQNTEIKRALMSPEAAGGGMDARPDLATVHSTAVLLAGITDWMERLARSAGLELLTCLLDFARREAEAVARTQRGAPRAADRRAPPRRGSRSLSA